MQHAAMCPTRPNLIHNLDVTSPYRPDGAPPYRRVQPRGPRYRAAQTAKTP